MSRRSLLPLSLALLFAACGGSSGGGEALDPQEVEALRHELFAAGITPLPAPPPVSDELFELGRVLFFDKVLSGNEDVSCATCHLPGFFTGDGRSLSSGVGGSGLGPHRGGGAVMARNSPPLFNLHLRDELLWDGRVRIINGVLFMPPEKDILGGFRASFSPGLEVLAAQALLPPFEFTEMRGFPGENELADLSGDYVGLWAALIERLLDLPGYVGLLRAAYPDVAIQDFHFGHAVNAMAAFEVRAFGRADGPFERFVRGDDHALTLAQVRGAFQFFGPGGCARCHSGPLLSNGLYHNIGLPHLGPGIGGEGIGVPGTDIGRENTTFDPADRFLFRTPSLLNVELTGPWGHAGQFAHLRDLVAHYRDPELSHRNYDVQANVTDPMLALTYVQNADAVLATLDPRVRGPIDFDVEAVVAFLRALTADDAFTLQELVPASVPSGLPIF